MFNSEKIKKIILDMGIDLCGIAPSERFEKAPKGFRPNDIYKDCRSVVVFAKQLPKEPLFLSNCIPYTYVNNILTQEIDRVGVEISLKLNRIGIKSVPIPSDDPYEYWEPEKSYGRAILSMRHAGQLAGLGLLGKNTLLINEKFGNMIQIGALLIELELEGDPIAKYEVCSENCTLCIESCPVKALNGKTVNQHLCRPISNFKTEKGYVLKKCNICRRICPNCLGIKS